MKNLTLINNEWKQRINPNITFEEKAILDNKSEDGAEVRRILIESIKDRSLIGVSAEEAANAQSIYDQNKIEMADLISVDVTFPQGTGVINCRVNGEHKQIRF